MRDRFRDRFGVFDYGGLLNCFLIWREVEGALFKRDVLFPRISDRALQERLLKEMPAFRGKALLVSVAIGAGGAVFVGAGAAAMELATIWAFHRVPHRRGGRLPDFVRYAGGAFCVRRSPRKGAERRL